MQVADSFANGGQVLVNAGSIQEEIRLQVILPGVTLPGTLLEKFFEDFAVDETDVPDGIVGLKPTIVYEAVRGMGGKIVIEQSTADELRFIIDLPAAFPD